jgi:hypothetical protein
MVVSSLTLFAAMFPCLYVEVELVVRGMLSSLLLQDALAFQGVAAALNESEKALLDTFMRNEKA